MKCCNIAAAAVLIFFALSSSGRTYAGENPAPETLVEGNSRFAFELYRKLKNTKGNLFFSPYSISAALAMTYAGARGATAEQMAETLHFPRPGERLHPAFAGLRRALNAAGQKGNVKLLTANSLWSQKGYPFLKEYLTLIKKYYGAAITPVDYITARKIARKTINAWVENKTEKKIRNIIRPGVLREITRLVLVNAIYFKGAWAEKFEKSATKKKPFHISRRKSVKAPMMNRTGAFGYAAADGIQILEIPYKGGGLSMIALLPGKTDGLSELEKAFTADNFARWRKLLRKREIEVFLPRFEIVSRFRLDDTLESMGMTDAFTSGPADFSGMDGNHLDGLFISAVIHKAFVKVNEDGTEAAAATAVVMERESIRIEPSVFRADHPFLFLIMDNSTKSILFVGRVTDPASKK